MIRKAIAVAALLVVGGLIATASAQDGQTDWLHGIRQEGELKYPPGFEQVDYVNVNAPQGGVVRFGALGSFDSLNMLSLAGETPGSLGILYETLMGGTIDEPYAQYGLLAEAMRHAEDFTSATFRLRDDIYWHDGVPITVDDVIWSFETQLRLPGFVSYYEHVSSVEQTGEREVTFYFDQADNRELPIIVGQVAVFPKHYWEATGADGNPRDITAPTLEIPLGSGPYRVKSVDPGRSIVYERVADYWGIDHPLNIGTNNFAEIQYEYFLDETVMFEAFKADEFDYWSETIARRWANEYDFAAVADGRVIREWFQRGVEGGPDPTVLYNPACCTPTSSAMIGYMWNIRREKFQDPRVREALTLAYPFEIVNEELFYGQYNRIQSYWDATELQPAGLPEGRELEILEGLRDMVPERVFGETYVNPVNSNPDELRENLRRALELLNEAGWVLQGNTLVNAETGQPFVIEFLEYRPAQEPQALRYQAELAKIGIEFQVRIVDTSQWVARARAQDFDVLLYSIPSSLFPGNELYRYVGSVSANLEGTLNVPGIENPAVDALIEMIVSGANREEIVAATMALDRVLMWNFYVTPTWTLRAIRSARWDRFSHPEPLPEYGLGFPSIWWYDEEKAAAVAAGG
jgi:microcin C transport system substrate-binding protein